MTRIFIAAIFSLFLWIPAQGQTITVTTLADENGTGADCSLREAIQSANFNTAFGGCSAGGVFETIVFSVSGTITLSGGQLIVDTSSTLVDGQGNITLVAGASDRIVQVVGGSLILRGLTLTGGDVRSLGFPNGVGGAIWVRTTGTLFLQDSIVMNSKALSGGGIRADGFTDIKKSQIIGNDVNLDGGGIYSTGDVQISESTISGNTAGSNVGGGINFAHQTNGIQPSLLNSTVSGNSGAGILHGQPGTSLRIENSTISGNLLGPGIFNCATGGEIIVKNSTITQNQAGIDNCGVQNEPDPVTSVYSTFLAENTGADVTGPGFTSLGHNLIGNPGTTTGFTHGVNNDQVGVSSVLLSPLADNGGCTETHALLSGSPAIDTGDCALSIFMNHDQRNYGQTSAGPRAVDGDLNGSAICDIGAYEFEAVPLPIELRSFSARQEGSEIVLGWKTASETNNAGFEVQEKRGEDFFLLDFVSGAGTTIEESAYSFTIENALLGKHVFRLKQIDFDGSFSYSHEIELTIESPTLLEIEEPYPNPLTHLSTVFISSPVDQHVFVSLYDITGKTVQTLFKGILTPNDRKQLTISGSDLPAGVYHIVVEGKARRSKSIVILDL